MGKEVLVWKETKFVPLVESSKRPPLLGWDVLCPLTFSVQSGSGGSVEFAFPPRYGSTLVESRSQLSFSLFTGLRFEAPVEFSLLLGQASGCSNGEFTVVEQLIPGGASSLPEVVFKAPLAGSQGVFMEGEPLFRVVPLLSGEEVTLVSRTGREKGVFNDAVIPQRNFHLVGDSCCLSHSTNSHYNRYRHMWVKSGFSREFSVFLPGRE